MTILVLLVRGGIWQTISAFWEPATRNPPSFFLSGFPLAGFGITVISLLSPGCFVDLVVGDTLVEGKAASVVLVILAKVEIDAEKFRHYCDEGVGVIDSEGFWVENVEKSLAF